MLGPDFDLFLMSRAFIVLLRIVRRRVQLLPLGVFVRSAGIIAIIGMLARIRVCIFHRRIRAVDHLASDSVHFAAAPQAVPLVLAFLLLIIAVK